MAIKFDIGDPKSKRTFHIEAELENLIGKKIGDTISGDEVDAKFSGVEFEITGASDKAGFPSKKDVEGIYLKKVMLTKGFNLHRLRKKKKIAPRKKIKKGYKKRRSVRGNTISADTMQINLKVTKEGKRSIAAILGKEEKPAEEKPAEKTE